ncbi:WXG100 family type VII secretion target [Micromonospora sp. NPDC005367]|uniref:WXG100 family type VII secretion target n=1 Tax=Micromonospora sp. NPDC005367 TaxID=3155590 RepID=UPI0033B3E403
MSDYTFDFNQADAVIYDMSQINTRIRSALDELQTSSEAHLQEWEGEAKNQYWISKDEWNRQAGLMSTFLDQARQKLLDISDGYGSYERRHAALWNNVRGG